MLLPRLTSDLRGGRLEDDEVVNGAADVLQAGQDVFN